MCFLNPSDPIHHRSSLPNQRLCVYLHVWALSFLPNSINTQTTSISGFGKALRQLENQNWVRFDLRLASGAAQFVRKFQNRENYLDMFHVRLTYVVFYAVYLYIYIYKMIIIYHNTITIHILYVSIKCRAEGRATKLHRNLVASVLHCKTSKYICSQYRQDKSKPR